MFRFRDFKVYKDAKEFCAFCENTIKKFSSQDNKALVSQIRSAYLSITLNIAEGSSCDSDKEFRRFLEMSLRSAHEVVAAFDIAFSLGLINDKIVAEIEPMAESLCKQINGFRRSLSRTV